MSSGARTRHINIKYFYIMDAMKRENVSIEHCPTDIMVADFFTKALQGRKFTYFRDIIMGIEPENMDHETPMT